MKSSNSILNVYNIAKPHGTKKIVLIISAIFSSFYNFIIANILNMLFQGSSEFNNYKLMLFTICIITVILGAISSYIIKRISTQNSLEVEKSLKEKLLSKLNNINFFEIETINNGEWMTISDSDVNRVSSFYQLCVINTINGVLSFCLAILFGLKTSWKLTLLIMTFSIFSMLLPKLIQKQLAKNMNNTQEIQESIRQFILITFNKIPLIKVTNSYEILQKRFSKQTYCYEQENVNQAKLTSLITSFSTLITYFSMAIWIFTGVYFISIGAMTIGGLFGFISLSSSFNWPLYIAPILQKESLQAQVSYNRITEFLQKEDDVKKSVIKNCTVYGNANVIMNISNLSFSYKSNNSNTKDQLCPILKYSNFYINKNEKVLLKGESGSGKTTLMKLLLGLYDPLTGSISLDSNSETGVLFSYVPQSNNIFTGTIRENLIIGNPRATDAEMKIALKQAAILDFVEELDEYIDSKIGGNHRKLSGGQMQRICLARAFLSNSEIVMIDEGTSAIDPINKELIIETLKKINKTIILISHDEIIHAISDRTISIESK